VNNVESNLLFTDLLFTILKADCTLLMRYCEYLIIKVKQTEMTEINQLRENDFEHKDTKNLEAVSKVYLTTKNTKFYTKYTRI